MFGELFLVEPAGAVDAAELRILLVAAPVCARNPRELECGGVELARRSEVRPAAHIHPAVTAAIDGEFFRSEEHTSELQSLMRISYAVFCLQKKKKTQEEYDN